MLVGSMDPGVGTTYAYVHIPIIKPKDFIPELIMMTITLLSIVIM